MNSFFLLRIIHFIFCISFTKERVRNLINFSSEIYLLIYGNATQILLNDSFYPQPSEVFVNKINKESNNISYELEYEINNVSLIFNETLNSTENMFYGLDNIIEIDLSLFDFSYVTTMENMFRSCINLEKIYFGNINTSSVTNMKCLFYNCSKLISIDVSNFDTSSVTTMERMFYNLTSLSTINLSNFNTSNVESFSAFLYNCSKLQYINISNFDTSKVTNMEGMFYKCSNLLSIDVSNFNTSKVESFYLMFCGCEKLISINVSNFNTSSATNLGRIFYNCSGLLSIDVTNFNTSNAKSLRSLFYNCNKLTSLNVSNFDTSSVTDMQFLFYNLSKIKSIDISNFNTHKIESLHSFFCYCQNLTSIDISFFDTSKITDFDYLFYDCIKLKSLNLLNFDTSSAKSMRSIFYNCKSLESLDLTTFDTSSVTFIGWMFYTCYSLKIIKFPEIFNTSQVVSMKSMFYDCNSIISLNLSTFDTSKVTDMSYMFGNCHNLKYLDIPNFSPINLKVMTQMFYNMSSLIFLNINSLEINGKTTTKKSFDLLPSDLKICSNKTMMLNYLLSIKKISNCSDICFIKNIKIDINKNECIHSCSDNGYNHECNNICYNECPDDSHIIIRNISNKENIFVEFEDGVAICLDRNPKGYYLDNNEFYEECHENCEFCYGPGNEKNNSCKKCISNLIFINDIKYINNCFEKCKYYYYFNESDNYICTESDNCTDNYNRFIFEKSKCIDKCENDDTYKYEYNNICYEKCPKGTINSSKKTYFCLGEENIYQSEIGNNEEIFQIIKNNMLYKYNISNGEEMVFHGENNFIFHITNTENELSLLQGKNNNTNKFSVIDLGECGDFLKKNNNINENTSLIIMKFEKLKDLGYDLFDINSPFYNDICTPYKSKDDTDVLLSDRINSYYYNDDTSCQSNCKFSDYLIESEYLKCECDIKNSEINTNNAESFSAKSIYQSFFDVLKYSNYKVLKCGKLIFTIKSITKNIGSILTIAYFLIFFIFLILYFAKGKIQLKDDFSNNFLLKVNKYNPHKTFFKSEISKENRYNELYLEADKKIDKSKIDIFEKAKYKQDININNNLNKNYNIQKNQNQEQNKKRKTNKNNPPKKKILIYKKHNFDNNYIKNIKNPKGRNIMKNLNNLNFFSESGLASKTNSDKKILEISEFNKSEYNKLDNYELNNLEYDSARKLDKRNFLTIYWSLLKREHLVIFTFITRDDHNITFVKYSRFFFLLCTEMAMNVFFFADETMHKMFLDYGKYNFIQQIPQIIYSTIISQLIEIFLCYLSLTDKYFYQIKNFRRISRYQLKRIIKFIQIKLILFFIFCSLMFIFYWYLITCFCTVYQNTQIAFIKDSIFSFVLGIFTPFGIYLIPSLLRIIALKAVKSNYIYLYKLSNLIPLF